MWHTYILRCADGTLYTGITNDLARRLDAHNRGTASKYTRVRRPVELVYEEAHPDRSHASRREAAIKVMPRTAKLRLTGKRRQENRPG
jgi:putative endonuclease